MVTKIPSQKVIRQRFMQAMEMVPNAERLGSLQQSRHPKDEAFLMTMSDVFGSAFHAPDVKNRPLAMMGRKLMGPKSLGHEFRSVGAYMAVQAVCAPTQVTERDRRDVYSKFETPESFGNFFQALMKSNLQRIKALRT